LSWMDESNPLLSGYLIGSHIFENHSNSLIAFRAMVIDFREWSCEPLVIICAILQATATQNWS